MSASEPLIINSDKLRSDEQKFIQELPCPASIADEHVVRVELLPMTRFDNERESRPEPASENELTASQDADL
jgi:hypothetical protein